VTKLLTIRLDDYNNQTVLNDLTNVNLIKITINNFIFKNSIEVDNYIKLPPHYHELNEIEDINSNTNNSNGYIKLNDSKLQFDFP
jgi:hypothetical protein